jgi:hypothetical protein
MITSTQYRFTKARSRTFEEALVNLIAAADLRAGIRDREGPISQHVSNSGASMKIVTLRDPNTGRTFDRAAVRTAMELPADWPDDASVIVTANELESSAE